MRIHLLPCLLLLPALAHAQMPGSAAEQTTENAQNMTNVGDKNFDVVSFNKRDDGVRGTPMLYAGWRMGEVLLVGNTKPLRMPLKYDVYRQELRARRPAGDSIVVPLLRVQEFSWLPAGGGAPQRFVRCMASPLAPELVGTCAEVLVPGQRWQLLKLSRKVLTQEADPSSSGLQPLMVKAFKPLTTYYLRWTTGGRIEPVKIKRAALESALVKQPAALAALRARRLSIGNEAELAAVVAALDASITE